MYRTPQADQIRLRHMLDAAKEAVDAARGKLRSDLDRDHIGALGLLKCLEIIGEAARYVAPETQNRYSNIAWPDIIGMRNQLVHVYFDVDLDAVWDTITDDLPLLIVELERILDAS